MTTTHSDEYYGTFRIAYKQVEKWRTILTTEEIESIRKGSRSYNTNLYPGF